MAPLTVALLGLGEAGSVLAGDLVAAGASVRGFDPVNAAEIAGDRPRRRRARGGRGQRPRAERHGGLRRARGRRQCRGRAARRPGLRRPQRVGRRAQARGGRGGRADRRRGSPTSRSWAWSRATGCARRRSPPVPGRRPSPSTSARSGCRSRCSATEPGAAAARKLLRSVFMKGLAASCLESLRAARAAGCEDWMREEIEGVFARRRRGAARAPGHRQRAPRDAPHRRGRRRPRAAGRARRRAARDRRGRRAGWRNSRARATGPHSAPPGVGGRIGDNPASNAA